jgi:hypothetical protein
LQACTPATAVKLPVGQLNPNPVNSMLPCCYHEDPRFSIKSTSMQDLSSMMHAARLRVFLAHAVDTPVMRLRGCWHQDPRNKHTRLRTPVDTPVMRFLYCLTDTCRIACEYVQTMSLRCQLQWRVVPHPMPLYNRFAFNTHAPAQVQYAVHSCFQPCNHVCISIPF